MGNLKIKGKDLLKLGFPNDKSVTVALEVVKKNFQDKNVAFVKSQLKQILENPEEFSSHLTYEQISEELLSGKKTEKRMLLQNRVPHQIFGNEISQDAINQFYTSLKLPISVKGALMPDSHYGYGLPIGGVLGVRNAVIPFGVGVDIGCRMSLSVLDIPISYLDGAKEKFKNALLEHTKFGMKEVHKNHVEHEIFDRETFDLIPILRRLKERAIKQMGTSGGGNHFVEFGEVEILEEDAQIGLPKGKYVGILSHSGSRGFGAEIAQHYTRVAIENCPLPKEAQHLAWLDLDTHLGQEYWVSMNLAGDYASACHNDIHRRLIKAVGGRLKARIENHHNFAWKEIHDGEELIVHRKGATPASENELGIIPGSMTSKGFIVRGLGNPDSLKSASHGAGRAFSRSVAKNTFTQNDMKNDLKNHKVTLIGGSLEEAPMVYKNINEVMNAQQNLVDILGTFQPRIVRMDK